jgi:excisionase family DNA binding protein
MQSGRGEPAGRSAPKVLTVKEAAAYLKVSTATVYKMCEAGRLRHVRLSTNCIRVPEDALAEVVGG